MTDHEVTIGEPDPDAPPEHDTPPPDGDEDESQHHHVAVDSKLEPTDDVTTE